MGLSQKIRDATPVYVDMVQSGVIDKTVLKAKDRAEMILEDAKVQAQRIKDEAAEVLSEVEAEREKARQNGFAKGYEDGLARLTERSVALEAAKEKFLNDAEPNVKKLVLTCVEKVIGKLVSDYEGVINSIVRQAVESALGERIAVRLNPEDFKAVTEDQLEFKDILGYTKRIHFKEDDTITKGGCIVETEVGTIDARLETQLKAIKKALEL